MKVSEIQVSDVIRYLKEDPNSLSQDEIKDIGDILEVAKSFIESYTGLTSEAVDTHKDFYIVVMVLCQDMYDNHTMYVEGKNLNRVVETILGMHCINLL